MSETSEIPMTPQETGEPPQVIRMEDMEEFQKMTPEQQEYLLNTRERLQNEAMDPRAVVTRSIDEMGFWEGLKETLKPHRKKHKEILIKELKAGASMVLSLIPVLGEGKGLGTGLFGVTVKAGAPVEQAIRFEPLVRGKKAIEFGKRSFSALHSSKTGGRVKDALRPLKAALGAKTAVERSLVHDFRTAAKEGSKILTKNFGVEGIQAAQRAKTLAKEAALFNARHAAHAANAAHKEWYTFPIRWARSAKGEVVGRFAAAKAGKEAGKAVTTAVKESLKSTSAVGKFVEGGVKRAAPAMIEGTRFGKFHAFFDKWLNLTPDVPFWVSGTTGVLEFLGAHGIDAIPAAIQIAMNRFQQLKLSKDMAVDVLSYTMRRVGRKVAERKRAAEVFS